MRDPERIERILRGVYLIWRSNPDLRLVQLILKVAEATVPPARDRVGMPPTYKLMQVEDYRLERELEHWVEERVSAIDRLGGIEAFKDAIIRHDG